MFIGVKMAKNYQNRNAKEFNTFRAIFQWITCNLVYGLYYRLAFNLKIEGRENVPKDGFLIVASNHVSAIDPFILVYALQRNIAFMAKVELFKNPIARFFLGNLGAFAVDRGKVSKSTIRTVLGLKQTKWCLGIFPQGTREQDGNMENINRGFAAFAKDLKCDVLPVAVLGAKKSERKFLKGKMKVKIGKPIPYCDNPDEMVEIWSKTITELSQDNPCENENKKVNFAQKKAKDFNVLTRLYQYYALYVLFLPIFGGLFYNFKIERNKKLENKPYIIAPNHISYMDVFIVNYAVGRPLAYMAKKELFKTDSWAKRWVTRNVLRLGAFAVNREKVSISTIKSVNEVFKANFNLCIFPQGGIRKNKTIENINEGFIYFAKRNKVDILPVALSGLETYNWKPFFKKNINVVVGTPISYTLPEDVIIKSWGEQIASFSGYENKY